MGSVSWPDVIKAMKPGTVYPISHPRFLLSGLNFFFIWTTWIACSMLCFLHVLTLDYTGPVQLIDWQDLSPK